MKNKTTKRPESFREELSTIIQKGHIEKLTSDEIAGNIIAFMVAEEEAHQSDVFP